MQKTHEFVVFEKQPIIEAVAVIQSNLSRCCVVLNESQKVIGVFSEGDVLRLILAGTDLYTPVKKVLKPSFHSLSTHDLAKAFNLVKKFGITLVPVLNETYELQSVITFHEIMEKVHFSEEKP